MIVPALVDVPLGIMFHRFVPDGRRSSQGSLTPEGLRRIVGSFSAGVLISPQEWMERLAAGRLAGHRCLTFDDGLRRQIDLALPVLMELGTPAFWFIPTGVLGEARPSAEVLAHALDEVDDAPALLRSFCDLAEERFGPPEPRSLAEYRIQAQRRFPFYSDLDCEFRFVRNSMDPASLSATVEAVLHRAGIEAAMYAEEVFLDENGIRQLHSAGQTIGLHSHSQQYDISALPIAEQVEEYRRNREELARVVGVAPTTVAHPLGNYSAGTLEVLEALGIVCGFRSEATAGFGLSDDAGPLEFARIDAAVLAPSSKQEDFSVS